VAANNPHRYYWVKPGSAYAYWNPGPRAKSFFLPPCQPLGLDGPAARDLCEGWNAKLDAARAEAKQPKKKQRQYPAGTLGHFYERFREMDAFGVMSLRGREDYDRAWPNIEKRFARTLISQIDAAASEAFHVDLHPAHPPHPERDPDAKLKLSWDEAHRTLKIWRALMNALVSYELRPVAPIGRVSNPAPKGRQEIWLHDEIMQLAWVAALSGDFGQATAIRLAWGAMLAPVDVWTLKGQGWLPTCAGGQAKGQRSKTSRRFCVAVDEATAQVVNAYIESQPPALPSAPIIRRANGKAYRNKDMFGDAFRAVRAIAFPGDERQFLDIRRSALTEARLGGATRDDIGKAAANRIDENDTLAETYLIRASEAVIAARAVGRSKMRNGK
jgi:hypothetical protein